VDFPVPVMPTIYKLPEADVSLHRNRITTPTEVRGTEEPSASVAEGRIAGGSNWRLPTCCIPSVLTVAVADVKQHRQFIDRE
jgi:hypothetical protein